MTPLRSRAAAIYAFVISSRFAFWLLTLLAVTFALWVVPFAIAGQAEARVGSIATSWVPLIVLYALIALATALCTLSRVRRDWKRSKLESLMPRAEGLGEGALALGIGLQPLADTLAEKRFEVHVRDDRLVAIRGRYKVLFGSVFHAALLLFIASLLLHQATLRKAGMELIEGQSAEEFFATTPPRDDREVFVDDLQGFRLVEVEPRFFDRYLLFERLDAIAEYRGETRTFSLSSPQWLSPVTYVGIQDFNYAPQVSVKDASGRKIDETVSSLALFPPGSEDSLELTSAKASLTMSVYPDHEVSAGRDISRSYNLRNPRIALTAFESVGGVAQQRVLARRLLKVGEPLVLPSGTTITVEAVRKVGTFTLVHAPALPLVLGSALLMFAGLAGRLLVPRVDVVARATTDGVLADARVDSLGRASGRVYLTALVERG